MKNNCLSSAGGELIDFLSEVDSYDEVEGKLYVFNYFYESYFFRLVLVRVLLVVTSRCLE